MKSSSESIRSRRAWILTVFALASVIALGFVAPIAQDPAYHAFADTRQIMGVANFWNVLSNLPFIVIGSVGLLRYRDLEFHSSRNAYLALCVGVLLVGFGSGWYHYAPSTGSLLWDRLPMTVAFMALFSMLLDERVIVGKRSLTLLPLLIVGVAAALYWSWTESRGVGDLRPYALVQFLPMVMIPLILWMYERRFLNGRHLVVALVFYTLAKVFEHFDAQVLGLLGVLSGHSIKHLVAAIAVYFVILAVPTKGARH